MSDHNSYEIEIDLKDTSSVLDRLLRDSFDSSADSPMCRALSGSHTPKACVSSVPSVSKADSTRKTQQINAVREK